MALPADANNYNPYATQDDGTCSYINTINFGTLECGETYNHKNEFTSLNIVQYEFHLNTRSIIQIDYNETVLIVWNTIIIVLVVIVSHLH